LTSIATFLTESVLRLPKHTLLARYTHLTLAFLLSGLAHMFGAVAAYGGPSGALSFRDSGDVAFFLAQALGIMIEDGVQALGKRLGLLRVRNGKSPWWAKALGRVWLVAFLGWSSPARMYPIVRLDTGENVLLPFSVVRALWKN
jgi:hypothetical protein